MHRESPLALFTINIEASNMSNNETAQGDGSPNVDSEHPDDHPTNARKDDEHHDGGFYYRGKNLRPVPILPDFLPAPEGSPIYLPRDFIKEGQKALLEEHVNDAMVNWWRCRHQKDVSAEDLATDVPDFQKLIAFDEIYNLKQQCANIINKQVTEEFMGNANEVFPHDRGFNFATYADLIRLVNAEVDTGDDVRIQNVYECAYGRDKWPPKHFEEKVREFCTTNNLTFRPWVPTKNGKTVKTFLHRLYTKYLGICRKPWPLKRRQDRTESEDGKRFRNKYRIGHQEAIVKSQTYRASKARVGPRTKVPTINIDNVAFREQELLDVFHPKFDAGWKARNFQEFKLAVKDVFDAKKKEVEVDYSMFTPEKGTNVQSPKSPATTSMGNNEDGSEKDEEDEDVNNDSDDDNSKNQNISDDDGNQNQMSSDESSNKEKTIAEMLEETGKSKNSKSPAASETTVTEDNNSEEETREIEKREDRRSVRRSLELRKRSGHYSVVDRTWKKKNKLVKMAKKKKALEREEKEDEDYVPEEDDVEDDGEIPTSKQKKTGKSTFSAIAENAKLLFELAVKGTSNLETVDLMGKSSGEKSEQEKKKAPSVIVHETTTEEENKTESREKSTGKAKADTTDLNDLEKTDVSEKPKNNADCDAQPNSEVGLQHVEKSGDSEKQKERPRDIEQKIYKEPDYGKTGPCCAEISCKYKEGFAGGLATGFPCVQCGGLPHNTAYVDTECRYYLAGMKPLCSGCVLGSNPVSKTHNQPIEPGQCCAREECVEWGHHDVTSISTEKQFSVMPCEYCHGRFHSESCQQYLKDGTLVCVKCYAKTKKPSSTKKAAKLTSPNREGSPKRACRNDKECGNCRTLSTSIPGYCTTGGRLFGQKCSKCKTEITPEFMKKVGEIYYCSKVGNKKPGEQRCTFIRCKKCYDVNMTPEVNSGKKRGRANMRSHPKKRKVLRF